MTTKSTKITSTMDGLRLETSGDGNVTVTAEAPVKVPIDTLIAELTSFSLAESGEAEGKLYPHLQSHQAPYNRLAG